MLILLLLSSFSAACSIPEEADLEWIAHHLPLIPIASKCDNIPSRDTHWASCVTAAMSKPSRSARSLNSFLPLTLLPIAYSPSTAKFPQTSSQLSLNLICYLQVLLLFYSPALPLINILRFRLNMKPWGILLVNTLHLSQIISLWNHDAVGSLILFNVYLVTVFHWQQANNIFGAMHIFC